MLTGELTDAGSGRWNAISDLGPVAVTQSKRAEKHNAFRRHPSPPDESVPRSDADGILRGLSFSARKVPATWRKALRFSALRSLPQGRGGGAPRTAAGVAARCKGSVIGLRLLFFSVQQA